jgi:hypothetical protein
MTQKQLALSKEPACSGRSGKEIPLSFPDFKECRGLAYEFSAQVLVYKFGHLKH